MKRYKLLRELPTFKAGDEFVLKDDGCLYLADLPGKNGQHWKGNVMAYHRNTLAHFPNILGDWFEEIHEEPKDYWYIDADGELLCEPSDDRCKFDNDCREIGNYFKTKEEAEEAVRKLQAWKRLKDKGFKFTGWEEMRYDEEKNISGMNIYGDMPIGGFMSELDTIFGGEE